MTPQEDKEEVVYLSKTRKVTMRSKFVIDKINEMKMKLGSKVTLRKAGKTKVDFEISMKAVNSAKRKRVEEALDLGQGDDRLPGTDRILTDVAMVPPILIAGIKSTGYKTKKSDRTLTGARLEMKILSQYGESTMKDFKPSPMNHRKESVVGQLVPVQYNRLTVSETVSIDEPASGYIEMLEYRNSVPYAVPYVRTELQLRFAWCMIGLTRGEYDSEERKRSKEEKVFLMTSVRDLMTQEGAAVACAKRRDALCFIRFMIEQISVPALSFCVKRLREGNYRAKALLLLELLDMHQSRPMRVNMKEPVELETMRKIDEIRTFSNKEMRLTKESMEPKNEMVTAISVEGFPVVLQTEQKHIGRWTEAIEAEITSDTVKHIADRREGDIWWDRH